MNASGLCLSPTSNEQRWSQYTTGGHRASRRVASRPQRSSAATADLSGNSCRDFFFVNVSVSPVATQLNPELHWGWDGASLESVSAFSHDPIAADQNLYRYCGNNPVVYVDPTGLDWQDWTIVGPIIQIPYYLGRQVYEWNRSTELEDKLKEAKLRQAGGDPDKLARNWNNINYSKGRLENAVQAFSTLARISVEVTAAGLGGAFITRAAAADAAGNLGFTKQVKDAPFNSHGLPVFQKGSQYITPDADSHIGGVWKLFDKNGKRLGILDATGKCIGQ
jgi:hypothetical protein